MSAAPGRGHGTGPGVVAGGSAGVVAVVGPAGSDEGWAAPVAVGPLDATVALPGSKSLTNRALILAALSDTPTRISAPLHARDTRLMAAALRSLGVGITDLGLGGVEGPARAGSDWLVTPGPLSGGTVDCGLAGTVMRFLPPLAALADGDSRFDGDPAARTRPMGVLIEALRRTGAVITDDGRGLLPFTVHGYGGLPGGLVELDASASSQFVSALLLTGARFDKGIDLQHVGDRLPSVPHIEMTIAVLRDAGAEVESTGRYRWRVSPGPLSLPDQVIEPDLSNAAPFLAAALAAGGSVRVPYWPLSTSQPGDLLRELLASMGAAVELDDRGLSVRGPATIAPLVADLHEASELTPVLAALCALADGQSRISGVGHIRGHETDRLAALRTELSAVGSEATETEDGLIIRPGKLHPARWHAYADHRMAQAGALLGLAVPGLRIDDIASTSKTLSDFPGMWSQMLQPSDSAVG